MSAKQVVSLVVVILVVGLVALFAFQNGPRVTDLHLELGVTRLQTQQPVSVVVLMGACLGVGTLFGWASGLIFRSSKKATGSSSPVTRERQDAWP
jgi:uncharacterized integral membrane protein